jgi:peptide/nickel transport system substrate-binding protein
MPPAGRPRPAGPPAGPAAGRPAGPGRARRTTAAVLAGLALLPALAACTDGHRTSPPPASDIATADRSRIRSGGTLCWAIDAVPSTLNAFQADASADTARVTGAVLPSLFVLDARGNPHRNPDYLDSAKVTSSSPRQTVRYRINRRAVWSDGTPVTAADFRAQWKALSGADASYWPARNDGYRQIRAVRQGHGPREVEVTFAQPYADWQALFTPLYPRSVTGSPDAFNDGSRRRLTVTSGPFTVARIDRTGDDRSVTLTRDPRWWGDRAKLRRIVLAAVPRDRRPDALARGRLDVAELDTAPRGAAAPPGRAGGAARRASATPAASAMSGSPATPRASSSSSSSVSPSPGAASAAGATPSPSARAGRGPAGARPRAASDPAGWAATVPGLTVRKAAGASFTQLTLNGSAGPLADQRVRRAVARAIDRRALAEAVLKPVGLPVRTLGNHLLMSTQDGYRDNSRVLGHTGAKPAESLLTKAGWKPDRSARPGRPRSGAGPQGSGPAPLSDVAASPSPRPTHPAVPRPPAGLARHQARDALAATLGSPTDDRGGTATRRTTVVEPRTIRVRHGRELTLRLLVPEGSASLNAVGERVAGMLARVGVRVRVTRVGDDSFFRDHVASGDFDLALFSWPGTPYPASDTRAIYAKPLPAPDGSLIVEQNYARVGTDEINELFREAAEDLDARSARKLAARADAKIWALTHSLPLYQRPEVVALRRTLANTGAFGFTTPRYQDMGFRR